MLYFVQTVNSQSMPGAPTDKNGQAVAAKDELQLAGKGLSKPNDAFTHAAERSGSGTPGHWRPNADWSADPALPVAGWLNQAVARRGGSDARIGDGLNGGRHEGNLESPIHQSCQRQPCEPRVLLRLLALLQVNQRSPQRTATGTVATTMQGVQMV